MGIAKGKRRVIADVKNHKTIGSKYRSININIYIYYMYTYIYTYKDFLESSRAYFFVV